VVKGKYLPPPFLLPQRQVAEDKYEKWRARRLLLSSRKPGGTMPPERRSIYWPETVAKRGGEGEQGGGRDIFSFLGRSKK